MLINPPFFKCRIARKPAQFLEEYENSELHIVNHNNVWDFILDSQFKNQLKAEKRQFPFK